MNIMIASDIHGSAYWCKEMLRAFERERAEKILLLGDILYHGPRNDLPRDYDPRKVSAMLNGIKERVMCVRGNCDSEVDQMMLEFPIMAEYCFMFVKGRVIYAAHGHHEIGRFSRGDIVLQGHTHIPAWEESHDGVRYLNPGSVSIPKNDSPHGYMLLNDEGFIWKNLDGEIYHSIISSRLFFQEVIHDH